MRYSYTKLLLIIGLIASINVAAAPAEARIQSCECRESTFLGSYSSYRMNMVNTRNCRSINLNLVRIYQQWRIQELLEIQKEYRTKQCSNYARPVALAKRFINVLEHSKRRGCYNAEIILGGRGCGASAY